jgi:Capsule assembly protein Wzi
VRRPTRILLAAVSGAFAFLLLPAILNAAPGEERNPRAGPVYVPLDSWIYPVLRRLAALGYVPDEEALIAPWTRAQCLVFYREAEDIASRHSTKISRDAAVKEANQLLEALRREVSNDGDERSQIRLESVYGRFEQISGTPLRDSYHFGQTLSNDYGRPFEQGSNTIDGFSLYGTYGRFSAYFRGEYQQAEGRPSYDPQTLSLLGTLDGVPAPRSSAVVPTNSFDPLEMYIGARLGIFDVTFGKQSMWWGPDDASAFHFSNNAQPFYSLRISQQTPIVLPGPFRYLGHIRTEFIVGKLSGHLYPPRPLINAQKITLQLTANFEVGFTRSSIFGGVGHPLTASSIFRSFFGTTSNGGTSFGSANDPGDRRSGFDFSWRLPGLRRIVTIYSDSLADDETNPLANPRRSAWAPGIYIAQLPKLPNLDLRFETYATWLYRKDEGGMFLYWNNQYRDAYTNNGYLLGSWVGRDARAYQASSTYWWSAKNKLTGSFRQIKIGNNFLPGGGTQTDVSLTAQWELKPNLLTSLLLQYERYSIPSLAGPTHDMVAGFQFTYYPRIGR